MHQSLGQERTRSFQEARECNTDYSEGGSSEAGLREGMGPSHGPPQKACEVLLSAVGTTGRFPGEKCQG